MSHLTYGIIAGLAFGTIAALSMVRLTFPDKRGAIAAAFVDRFAIGLVIGVANLAWPSWSTGLFFGVLLSLPSAIITKAWAPILIMGGLGGTIIGVVLPMAVK